MVDVQKECLETSAWMTKQTSQKQATKVSVITILYRWEKLALALIKKEGKDVDVKQDMDNGLQVQLSSGMRQFWTTAQKNFSVDTVHGFDGRLLWQLYI